MVLFWLALWCLRRNLCILVVIFFASFTWVTWPQEGRHKLEIVDAFMGSLATDAGLQGVSDELASPSRQAQTIEKPVGVPLQSAYACPSQAGSLTTTQCASQGFAYAGFWGMKLSQFRQKVKISKKPFSMLEGASFVAYRYGHPAFRPPSEEARVNHLSGLEHHLRRHFMTNRSEHEINDVLDKALLGSLASMPPQQTSRINAMAVIPFHSTPCRENCSGDAPANWLRRDTGNSHSLVDSRVRYHMLELTVRSLLRIAREVVVVSLRDEPPLPFEADGLSLKRIDCPLPRNLPWCSLRLVQSRELAPKEDLEDFVLFYSEADNYIEWCDQHAIEDLLLWIMRQKSGYLTLARGHCTADEHALRSLDVCPLWTTEVAPWSWQNRCGLGLFAPKAGDAAVRTVSVPVGGRYHAG
mmetsp:Transcript_12479/g.33595  ORF Transcript_12479/g.33595 Transcript_12479/m.33595 type:complete len:412 (-) Transcript_12479:121-1356(-)